MAIKFLRRPEVEERTGLSRSTIYLRIKEGTFPAPVKLGARSVGWIEHEISNWSEARMRMRDNASETG
ncbi:MAG: AlpA family transcriptional regulator [Deltaproteobacteria bacterium]|nr:AlpA family transcriptional regulator [Deltaproteobacteria bacterium]